MNISPANTFLNTVCICHRDNEKYDAVLDIFLLGQEWLSS